MAGSQRCFCSSLPSRPIEPIARPDCTPKNVLMLPSPRDISRETMPGGEPAQAGAAVAVDGAADEPSSAILGTSGEREVGPVPVVVDDGEDSASTKARTRSRTARASSVQQSSSSR